MTAQIDAPEIFLLRHGRTWWNAIRRCQGQQESALDAVGVGHARTQAQIIRPVLRARPELGLWSSPLLRARQTAAIVFGPDCRRARYDPRLAEVAMGGWEGRLHSEIDAELAAAGIRFEPPFLKYVSAPGGERLADLQARAASFLRALDGPAVIVAHGVINAVMRALLLGLDLEGMSALTHEQGVVLHIAQGRERRLAPPEGVVESGGAVV